MKLRMTLLLVGLLSGSAVPGFTNSNADAQTETVLYSFGSVPNDGTGPQAGLVQGSDGNFYGTTPSGGLSSDGCECGTVFRIGPSVTYTSLYSFGGSPSSGVQPFAGLVQGSDGNFYGTTLEGGENLYGAVFRISPGGTYTNLYSFVGYSAGDGDNPWAGLVQGSAGNFYGTTTYGGTNGSIYGGFGTVFRISASGSYTSLYSFAGSRVDGSFPYAVLVQGGDGNFYGTTYQGGTSTNCPGGCGTVFRISPGGSYTSLYSFGSVPNDGSSPYAGLVQGSNGNLYGTTEGGGTHGGGTVFQISPSGSCTSLYSFSSVPNDGSRPVAGLIQGSDGDFYGTTVLGGTSTNYCRNGCGTVFRISPSGTYTTVYWFGSSSSDGRNPTAALVQGSDGDFYGTTFGGGEIGLGSVFKLTVPVCEPPVISDAAVTPNVLWPPNHKMALVTIDYTTTENCGGADCELSATSHESDASSGDGDAVTDIQLIPDDAHHVYLRAERSPSGSGRVYTISITCTDTSGNVSTKTAEVTVPHDQGENQAIR